MANNVFDTVTKEDSFQFFHNCSTDYVKIKKVAELNKKNLQIATGIPLSSIRFDVYIPKEIKELLEQLALLLNLVARHFNDINKALLWYRTSNPLLGYVSPKDMIILGKHHKLMKFVYNSLDENEKT